MLAIPSNIALWLALWATPICLYVCWSDLTQMKIYNKTVLLLAAGFAVIGFALLPTEIYLWHLAYLAITLVAGIIITALGVMGGGDAKFIAAAAPFVWIADLLFIGVLFSAVLIASFILHRGLARTPLRQAVPDWKSWQEKGHFPMGLALGPTLAGYLWLGAFAS